MVSSQGCIIVSRLTYMLEALFIRYCEPVIQIRVLRSTADQTGRMRLQYRIVLTAFADCMRNQKLICKFAVFDQSTSYRGAHEDRATTNVCVAVKHILDKG